MSPIQEKQKWAMSETKKTNSSPSSTDGSCVLDLSSLMLHLLQRPFLRPRPVLGSRSQTGALPTRNNMRRGRRRPYPVPLPTARGCRLKETHRVGLDDQPARHLAGLFQTLQAFPDRP